MHLAVIHLRNQGMYAAHHVKVRTLNHNKTVDWTTTATMVMQSTATEHEWWRRGRCRSRILFAKMYDTRVYLFRVGINSNEDFSFMFVALLSSDGRSFRFMCQRQCVWEIVWLSNRDKKLYQLAHIHFIPHILAKFLTTNVCLCVCKYFAKIHEFYPFWVGKLSELHNVMPFKMNGNVNEWLVRLVGLIAARLMIRLMKYFDKIAYVRRNNLLLWHNSLIWFLHKSLQTDTHRMFYWVMH